MKKIFYLFASILCSIFLNIILVEFILDETRCLEQQQFLKSTDADIIVVYKNGDIQTANDFYYLSNNYSVEYNDKKIKADILMIKTNTEYTFFKTSDLKEKEVILSKNISVDYNLKIDDKIYVSSAFSDQHEEYLVKDIIEPIYSITVDYLSPTTGLIIFGNDIKENEMSYKSLAFVDNSTKLTTVSIDNMLSINKIENKLNDHIVNLTILHSSLILILCIVLNILLYIFESSAIKKNIIMGLSFNKIISKYSLFPIFASIIIVVFSFTSSMIISFLVLGYISFSLLSFSIILIPFIVFILELLKSYLLARGI